MIAADTSVWIDYSKEIENRSTHLLEGGLRHQSLVIPTPVLYEVLSGPKITSQMKDLFCRLPRIDLTLGTWERAAQTRQTLLRKNLRARSMDCLIAQVCMDHQVPLITMDGDFRHFTRFGLKLGGF